jgi:hypothetical protein
MMRGGYVRFAARERFGDAQEADEVGAVGVEELSVTGGVSGLFVGRGKREMMC